MKVVFYQRVCAGPSGSSSSDKKVFRVIEMPFAPYPGLFVYFDDGYEFEIPEKDGYGKDNWMYGGLSWDVKNNLFMVSTKTWNSTLTVSESEEYYLKCGWMSEEAYRTLKLIDD